MKNDDKNKESSYLQHWDVNNLYGWAMSQKLWVNNLVNKRYFSIYKDFIKNYTEESDHGYFLGIDVQYLENMHGLHNDLSFLLDRIKIEKVEKLVANLHEDVKYTYEI